MNNEMKDSQEKAKRKQLEEEYSKGVEKAREKFNAKKEQEENDEHFRQATAWMMSSY